MSSEILMILQTLNALDGPASLPEIVLKSGLSRGKVLGNLPKLYLDDFVDKYGMQYTISKRGRAVLRELEPIPENNGFYFNLKENLYTGLVAYSLKDFYEIIGTVDVESLEFHVQRGDFENWIREILLDEDLADEVAEAGSGGTLGEALRSRLCEAVGKKYKMLKILVA